jgi:hypothetical protein
MTTNNLKGLFSTTEQTATNGGGAHQLQATAQLTNMSAIIADQLLKTFETDVEKYNPMVASSMKSHDAMDQLIAEGYDLQAVDVDFLKAESTDTLEKMLRSQQSKRSRSKSKVMTLDNYRTMLIGAIAENLLRIASGKPKSAGGGFSTSDVGYSDDELQTLANDSEALKKAIRNVQSKKSIMKSKADFDETSDRWQQLLIAEETLKSLRIGGDGAEVKQAVEAKHKIEEMLATVNLDEMKGADAKKTLAAIQEMLAGR